MARSARASRFGTTLASCGGLILRVVSADSRRCGFGTTPGSCGELILWVASGGLPLATALPRRGGGALGGWTGSRRLRTSKWRPHRGGDPRLREHPWLAPPARAGSALRWLRAVG